MSLAKLFVEVGANTRGFQNGMQDVRSEINRTSKEASNFAQTINTAIGVGLANVTAKATKSLVNFVDYVKKTGEEFNSLKENSLLAFETMLGSTDKATQHLKELQKFAEQTPFELPGLIDSSQKLQAFGFQAQSVIPMLTAVGDAVSGLGGSPEKLNRVIIALGQIKAKGKVQAQELLQLTEAGIPAWDMLAKKLGVSIPDAMERVEKGFTTAEREASKAAGNTEAMTRNFINADTAIAAIIEGMNKRFGGLMAKQSKSFTGLRSTFNDLLRGVAGKLTKPWFDNAKRGLETMIKLMQSDKFAAFITKAVKVSEKASNLVSKVKHDLLDYAIKGAHFFSSLFGGDSSKSFSFLDVLPKKIKGLVSYIKPIGDFIYNIADKGFRVFTHTFDDFYRSFNKISNQRFYFFGDMSLSQFANGIKSIFREISSGGKNLNYWLYTAPKVFQVITRLVLAAKNIFSYFSGEGLQTTLKKLGSILTGLGSTLAKLVRPFKEALGGLFAQLATMKNLGFADVFKAVLASVVKAFSGFLKVIKDEFWPTVKGALIWVFDNVYSFVTAINWGNLWTNLVTSISAIYTTITSYLSSVDWSAVWSTIWQGLATINDFFKSTVFPALGSFFDWLLSWFSDTSKNNSLLAAVTATWNFVADWASYIWSGVSPYLSSFFGWLTSWFTDQSKRQQLYGAITTTWSFVTTWASELWGFVSPYLGSFFSYLASWFTDTSKKQQLYTGLINTWTFVKDWANYLWQWISPYLSTLWANLSSWFTDPTKNASLWQSLKNGWNAFTQWGASLWGWLAPNLVILAANLKAWIDTNAPTLGSWINAFTKFSTDVKKQWDTDLPEVVKQFIYLKDTIVNEVPNIISTLDRLSSRFGEGWNFTPGQWFAGLERDLADLIKTASKVIEIIDAMVATTQAALSMDWQGYVSNSLVFGQKLSEFGAIWQQNQEWWNTQQANNNQQPIPFPGGHAKGGITKGGLTLVGEKGPELVQLPKGSRVWDHGQSMGKLQQNQPATYQPTMQQSSNQTITVILKNEGELVASRKVIDDIAVALQRRLTGNGNRVVFA